MYSDHILTIVTPAATSDLVTLATVKAELNITGSGEDAELGVLIARASAAVQTFCNRIFGVETLNELIRPARSLAKIRLSRAPLKTLTSVKEDDATLAATDYEADSGAGLIYRLQSGCRALWCAKKIEIAFLAGYDAIPADVQQATLSLITNARSGAGRDGALKSEEIPGVIRQEFWVGQIGDHGAFPPNVTALLEPYRRVVV